MALDANQLSSLLRLSAPGFNRAIGSGDVVPYTGATNTGGQTAGDAVPATPGPSGQFGAPAATPGGSGSFLNNLSALTPLLNQLLAAQSAASVPSGQGNAQAQAPAAAQATATPESVLGAIAPAGAPAPAGIAAPAGAGEVPAYGTPAFWNWYAAS